jgi:hypothetical protein
MRWCDRSLGSLSGAHCGHFPISEGTVLTTNDCFAAGALRRCGGDAMMALAGQDGGRESVLSVEEIEQRLELLRVEHRDLDCAIKALSQLSQPDQLLLARMKKRKLRLRDEIMMLENSLIPDIIA